MLGRTNLKRVLSLSVLMIGVAKIVTAETSQERLIKSIDDRYAIASKDFGDGDVQLHTRLGSGDNATHEIHNFNCSDETYHKVFESDNAPDSFPVDMPGTTMATLERSTDTAAMAAHACNEHGYPSLSIEW